MKEQAIRDNILKILLYYHIFEHPLTLDEIHLFYPNAHVSKKKLKTALAGLVAGSPNLVGEHNGFYYIGPNGNFVGNRLKRERISHRKWQHARVMTIIIKMFPFVRGVFVTGTLSKNSSVENSDIDFMIVCQDNRLWIARTLLRLFTKLMFNRKLLCINYFLSETNLCIDDKNLFTATELAHIKVMYNADAYEKLMRSNRWIGRYFPRYLAKGTAPPLPSFRTSDAPNLLQRPLEWLFPGKIGNAVDGFLQRVTKRHLKRTVADYTARECSKGIVISATTAKMHGNGADHKYLILGKYKSLFRQYNLT